jgi:DNA (cytosine-5)-methyltransferase 1
MKRHVLRRYHAADFVSADWFAERLQLSHAGRVTPGSVTAAASQSQPGQSHFQPGASPWPVTAAAASRLVLSLFPGAGLLDRGFEQAGFCVVRGPDMLLGQRIEDFHAPAGHFAGVIGGPPCQDFSRARRRPPTGHGLAMLKEFARAVTEARPDWWLLENVPGVPSLAIPGYHVQRFNVFASHFGGLQRRNRAMQFGSLDGVPVVLRRTESHSKNLAPAVLARDRRRTFADRCELQGLPRWFDLPGLSRTAKIRAVGNGVPVYVAAAIGEAIRDRSVTAGRLCGCGCGRELGHNPRSVTATAACRKRLERSRRGVTPGTVTI